jgi:ribosomal protein S18 acetylase RimI-like enzyme
VALAANVEVHDVTRNTAQNFFEDAWLDFNQELFGERFLWTMTGEYHLGASRGDGPLIGAARYSIAEGVGYLRELVVLAEERGSGVGGELLDRFEADCRGRGCHKLFLDVASVNTRAQAFYARHGWQQEGVMRNHWRHTDFQNWIKWL